MTSKVIVSTTDTKLRVKTFHGKKITFNSVMDRVRRKTQCGTNEKYIPHKENKQQSAIQKKSENRTEEGHPNKTMLFLRIAKPYTPVQLPGKTRRK